MKKYCTGILACIVFLLTIYAHLTAQDATIEEGIEYVSIQDGVVSQNVTLDFKDADIQNVLKIISYKSGVNIVATPDVTGQVTIRLVDVPWEMALDVILKTYGYGYQRQGNVILVTKMENISKIQAEEPLQTEVFTLKFLDAQDAQKIIIPLMSPRGKISVLYARGQKGWRFGSFKIGRETTSGAVERDAALSDEPQSEPIYLEKDANGQVTSQRADFQPSVKSKMLIVTDTASSLDRIRNLILPLVDKRPKQVLIEAKLIEVNRDVLRDLGVDWGLGSSTGAESSSITTQSINKNVQGFNTRSVGGNFLASNQTLSLFSPAEGTTAFPGTYPYNLGGTLIFKKLSGYQFESIMHALEQDVRTNTLSSPRILTLDNQEASILVGYHTPILAATVTAGTTSGSGATITQSLDYYQEIGIRLNVVPQISDDGYINMIVHPSVTSSTSSVEARSTASGETTTTNY
ncbi:MAG: secretin and TonB N-terminal domain-containing protein, partial [Candidatus Omnitrophica bacterium]|nr:secretin and TonB N-terminal domain-containing protein [Candidatus Omnitrophota bacterium]